MNNFIVILANVKHSQRLNDPPLQVWVISNINGSIESAHCTCMAGAGEVCSHVGALLYAAEYIVTARDTTSCTDVRSLWNVPKLNKVRCEPLKNMDFGRTVSTSVLSMNVPAVTEDEMIEVLRNIKEAGSSSVLMRVVEPFATDLEVHEDILPNPYKTFYNYEYEALYLEQLLQLSEQYIYVIISQADCKLIEEVTRGQAASNEWFHQRAGRVTASRLKQVCATSVTKPSLSLIKQICYPLKFTFKTKATQWGLEHESLGLDTYRNSVAMYHQNFIIEKCGLIINPELPQFGASPDALIHCECCGDGCVEIKCPFILKTMTLIDFARKKASCLFVTEEGCIYLDKKHQYYFQIQQQLGLTQRRFCDFIIWSPQELFIERIHFNEDFWHCHRDIALNFHQKVVIPELLGHFYTKSTPSIPTWCICNEPDDGRPMLSCDNELCKTMWYHLECIELLDIPNSAWFCHDCLAQ